MSAAAVPATQPGVVPSVSVTVVICAYTLERWGEIQAALHSTRQQSAPVHEVVLVADHNDELLDRARTAFPDVVSGPHPGPQGPGGAGRCARSSWLLITTTTCSTGRGRRSLTWCRFPTPVHRACPGRATPGSVRRPAPSSPSWTAPPPALIARSRGCAAPS